MPVLQVVAFAMPALATINVLNGALRGAGDTRWPWVIVLLGYLGVRMPLTYWLVLPTDEGGLGWGLRGAWIAMLADLCTRGVWSPRGSSTADGRGRGCEHVSAACAEPLDERDAVPAVVVDEFVDQAAGQHDAEAPSPAHRLFG